MDKKKIITIAVIVVVAIVAIVGIMFMGGSSKENTGIEIYTAKTSKEFDNKLIKDYKEMRKLTRELSIERASKNHQDYNLLETFNEDYFQTNKLAVISIYEDNTATFDYHIDEIKYNEDKTTATIEYTNIASGYDGSLTSSWINCIIVELEGTVTSVNFIENKE